MEGDAGEVALSRDEVREIDRLAIEELGIPGLVLMENAGLGATLRLLELAWDRGGVVHVLCGGGNNAGDGYVVARQLACRGIAAEVHETARPGALPPDAAVNRAIAERIGIPLHAGGECADAESVAARLAGAALIVDALLGTGFRGEVRPPLDAWIAGANLARERGRIWIVALDVPSGLDADRGGPGGIAIHADWTLTFVAPKLGFAARGAARWTGEVLVVPIGTPRALTERVLAARGKERSART